MKGKISKSDLTELMRGLGKKYPDFTIRNSAKTLIKLELEKIDLQKVADFEAKKSKNKINKESSKPQESTILPLQIGRLSKKLEWSTKYFQRILRIKNIIKNENDLLSPEELSSIMPMINDRLQWIIKKQEVERNLKKPFGRKSNEQVSNSGNSVYGELKKFGPGKLIYIRSK
ncbi:MAG: hypothetical protein JXB49_14025 [Bacteroidales bacterium]|nr:hypothetical protein [Bacteroidales bacterium]